MNGYITEGPGWMQYQLHADCYPKPKRIVFRNHNNAHIKRDGAFIPVRFNYNAFSAAEQIPMRLQDGEWVMADSADGTT